ncbi:MAG: hypothetical protein IK125_02555 [Lachnospiraceae bacterium]|nr:hypothetical protein [Lachnospiraceae bacterium]
MVRTYKCPGCGGALEYDPLDEKLHCSYCNSAYAPEEISRREMHAPPMIGRELVEETRKHATITMNIAICNSCGAELAVNGVEASSFCPYCGNAAVVMDRVEERLAPDYVIPFKVGREEAERIIRDRLNEGFYVPKGIKNFELEKLRGIYIPFWLYDTYYGADQKWKYRVSRGKNSSTYYAHMTGECTYHHLTVDASWAFNDDSSQRLEPYDMHGLKPFDPSYLSGFYSDRFDVGYQEADHIALSRASDMYNASIKERIGHKDAKLEENYFKTKVLQRDYGMLPVWFLTFRQDEQPYTLLVNGQTKKMVGAVPFDKKKAIVTFLLFATVFCLFFGFIGGYLMDGLWYTEMHRSHRSSNNDGAVKLFIYWLLAIGFLWYRAVKRYLSMKKSIELSRSRTNNRLAKERQDKV